MRGDNVEARVEAAAARGDCNPVDGAMHTGCAQLTCAADRFAAECQWGCRGGSSGTRLDASGSTTSSALPAATPKCSATISLALKADGSFSLTTELVLLSRGADDPRVRHEVLSASSLYGSYIVSRCVPTGWSVVVVRERI